MHVSAPSARSARTLGAPSASPVTESYRRLAEAFPSLRVDELPADGRKPSGDGWVAAADLAAGGAALDTFLAWDEAQIERDYGRPARPDVIASFGLHRYAWPVCLLMTLPWFLQRRVPVLPTEGVFIQRTLGRTAVRVGAFACLPDDPAAGLPGALVVSGEEALRARLRTAVADHLRPVLEAFAPRMRRGPRALWGMATDEIVEGLWYIGHLLGQEQHALEELAALLPGASAPFAGSAGFRELTGPRGEVVPTRDRISCCLFYTLRPDATCVTCPRTCDAERLRKLCA